ncbi:MAG: hypothetical protein KatS3mg002_0327 [Candidatus Woesearchaeota archaeon]|nr:MAG: hypothetical protein KatS3mg002_0327 [Candidatus Woesearchaeota archaeon]
MADTILTLNNVIRYYPPLEELFNPVAGIYIVKNDDQLEVWFSNDEYNNCILINKDNSDKLLKYLEEILNISAFDLNNHYEPKYKSIILHEYDTMVMNVRFYRVDNDLTFTILLNEQGRTEHEVHREFFKDLYDLIKIVVKGEKND